MCKKQKIIILFFPVTSRFTIMLLWLVIEGNVEKKVPTRTDCKVFLNWYVYSIQQYKEHVKEFRVINATEGGAKIAGTDIM